MRNEKIKSSSWAFIITMCILFWPVGFYLLYKKLLSDKSVVLKNSKTIKIVGIVFIALSIIYIIMGLTGELKDSKGNAPVGIIIIVILFFGCGGLFRIRTSKKMQIQGEKFKKYISIIINNNETSIDNIAAYMNVSCEEVVNDLKTMIDKGYFLNAYVDLGSREFVIRTREYEPINVNGSSSFNEVQEEKPKMKVVVCRNCGGNNTILEGEVSECEFCGSPLS